jgi:hypothetical protein
VNIDPKAAIETPEELYESAPCGYLSTLPDGTIIRANQTCLTCIGADSDEAGRLFRGEAGHLFRFHSGQCSDLKPDTLLV